MRKVSPFCAPMASRASGPALALRCSLQALHSAFGASAAVELELLERRAARSI